MAVHPPPRRQRYQIEIAGVAHPVLGVVEQRARLRGTPVRAAGTEADDRKTPLWPADTGGVERRGRAGNRAGGALRSGLGDDQFTFRPDRGQRRALRHPVAAGHREHRGRRIGKPRSLRLESARLGRTSRARQAARRAHGSPARPPSDRSRRRRRSRRGRGHDARWSSLTRPISSPGSMPRSHPTPSASSLGWITRRVADPGSARSVTRTSSSPRLAKDAPPAVSHAGRAASTVRATSRALEQRADDRLGRLGVVHAPARRRVVERELKASVARGRDRGRTTERSSDAPRQPIGPVMPAQERHGDAAVLGDRDHRRLAFLVREQRRQDPDHDAARAQRHDRSPAGKQIAQRRGEIPVEDQARLRRHPFRRPVQICVRDRRQDALRDLQATRAEQDDRRDACPCSPTRRQQQQGEVRRFVDGQIGQTHARARAPCWHARRRSRAAAAPARRGPRGPWRDAGRASGSPRRRSAPAGRRAHRSPAWPAGPRASGCGRPAGVPAAAAAAVKDATPGTTSVG